MASVAAETPVEANSEASSEEASASEVSPAEMAAAPAEPELVEVWRPGGRSEERRPPRHDRNRHRRPDRAAEGTQPVAAGEAAAGDGAKRERHRGGRRDRHRDFNKLRPGQPAADGAVAAPAAADSAPARESRDGEHGRPRDRVDGKGHGGDRNKGKREDGGRDKGRDKGRGDRGGRDRDRGGRENGPSHRQYASSANPRERDRPIDPNSPFAKLAALKEQMSANRKDP